MQDLLSGFAAFIYSYGAAFFLGLINLILEELLSYKMEFRKGFSKRLKVIALSYVRDQRTVKSRILQALALTPIVLALQLIPNIEGVIFWQIEHSLWVFLILILFSGFLRIIFSAAGVSGLSEDYELNVFEKNIAASVPIIMGIIVLIMMSGTDQIEKIIEFQNGAGLFILYKFPIGLMVAILWALTIQYSSLRATFSKKNSSFVLPPAQATQRAVVQMLWVVVFLGGSGIDIIWKVIVLNIIWFVLLNFIFRLRDDQQERFILWEVAPLALLVALIGLIVVGIK